MSNILCGSTPLILKIISYVVKITTNKVIILRTNRDNNLNTKVIIIIQEAFGLTIMMSQSTFSEYRENLNII
jgi:hypothetical protein